MINLTLSDSHWSTFVKQQAERSFYYNPAWLDLIIRLYGYTVIPLTATNSTVQRQIKKSQSLGVQVRVAQQGKEMAHYYQLHQRTRCRKHGMPAQPQRFFSELWDAFAPGDVMQVLLAEYQGSVIAGMILFAYGTTVR